MTGLKILQLNTAGLPWVREVSEARRPSLKLIGERLCVSLC